ncbi:MAG TPA: hypothetical protein VGX25_16245 [Actinophytocola sp.]|uniref:hypothetical protein n=1 Tax=Actinophytocola sp. TaxID=1872138 RepID=UPI002DDCE396|nr:hypothetical protein [Actinophytocola sp.]HEV2780935.1 hypothetical protein [Actinophytocola sp.]
MVLDRMHVLWGIENADYDAIYPAVVALGPGTAVTDPAHLALLRRALSRTLEPVLPREVAAAQYGVNLGAAVGAGQPNNAADVLMVQDLLHSRWHLTNDDYVTERAAASGGGPTPETMAGISRLKAATLAGTGRTGWAPLIRADESGPAGPGGTDRLADRTFTYGEFLVFVPAGAAASLTNHVHVFFSAAGVIGGSSHVEHHGLRGAADAGSQILIGVRGEEGRAFTISLQQIVDALASTGRPATVSAITMSAHSRGNAGLAATLRRRLIPASLIHHITILDANDQAPTILAGIRASGVPLSNVTADIVTTGQFGTFPAGIRTRSMDPAAIRAIGYARLINDAQALSRVSPFPPAIAALAAALPLPARGSFTTANPAPSGKVNINAFTRDPTHAAALRALRTGERRVSDVGALAGSEERSAYAFIEWNDLLNLRNPNDPRSTWRSVSPGIYSHHLFVAEVAGETLA